MSRLPAYLVGAGFALAACGSPEGPATLPTGEAPTVASKPAIPNDAPYPETTTTTKPPAKECWDFTNYLKDSPDATRITLPADSICEIPLYDASHNKTNRVFKAGQSMGIICMEQVQGEADAYLHVGPIDTTQDPSKYSIKLAPDASAGILYTFDNPADILCQPEQLPTSPSR